MPSDSHSGAIFVRSFLVCLVLISLPVKNLAYIVPPVYLLLEWWWGNGALLWRTALLLLAVTCVSALSMLWDVHRGREVNVPGMLISALTFMPVVILLCERFNRQIDAAAYERLSRICSWYVIFQAFVGVGQFVISRNPDAVCGTLGLLDFRSGTITISQVYFTFIIFGMLLFIVPGKKGGLQYTALVLGLLVCVLAQSGHQTIFFAAALMILALTQVTRPVITFASAAAVVMVLLLVAVFYPKTYRDTTAWYRKTLVNPNSPRRLVMDGALQTLTDGKNLALGTGLGQFTSRAALITSGDYLSRGLPPLLTARSDYYDHLVEPANRAFEDRGEGSAIAKPYSTWQTLLIELGPFQLLLLGGVIFHGYRENSKLIKSRLPVAALIGMAANVGLLFFVLCCTIENYAEFPQAVFLPMLLYVAAISRARMIVAEAATAPATS